MARWPLQPQTRRATLLTTGTYTFFHHSPPPCQRLPLPSHLPHHIQLPSDITFCYTIAAYTSLVAPPAPPRRTPAVHGAWTTKTTPLFTRLPLILHGEFWALRITWTSIPLPLWTVTPAPNGLVLPEDTLRCRSATTSPRVIHDAVNCAQQYFVFRRHFLTTLPYHFSFTPWRIFPCVWALPCTGTVPCSFSMSTIHDISNAFSRTGRPLF